jgi:hypothetical protein
VERPAAGVLAGYAAFALAALVVALLAPEPWAALGFVLGVLVAAVGVLVLVWSRVDVEGVRHLFRRDER